MASLQGLQARQILSRGIIGQVADDQPVAIRLRYIGTGTVTSVTITTATNIVMITSDGGTQTYAFATYTTIGALADKINTDGIFEARVLDALRSSATTSTLIDGAITISSTGYFDVLSDTSGANFLAYRITYSRGTPSAGSNVAIRREHRVHLLEIFYNATLGGGADANGLRVYETNPVGQVESLIWQRLPVSATNTTINWASGVGKITADEGNDLVVYLTDATSVTGYLSVSGVRE